MLAIMVSLTPSGGVGPDIATLVTASESFPIPVRGRSMGFAAIVGKAKAAISTQVFTPVRKGLGGGKDCSRVDF